MPRTFENLYETWRKPMLYVAEQILQDHHLAEDAVQNVVITDGQDVFAEIAASEDYERLLRAIVYGILTPLL